MAAVCGSRAGVEFVDGASHFLVDERPEVVLERALEFFAPTRGAGHDTATDTSRAGSMLPGRTFSPRAKPTPRTVCTTYGDPTATSFRRSEQM